jgi:hypothetical protein
MKNYRINTGTIVELMNSNFNQFNREFLHNEFYYMVKYHLDEKNTPATVPFTEENRDNLNSYKDRYKQDRLKSINYANYPFPDYYLREKKINNERVFEIVEINSDCPVEKEDENFDLFFAYQLALTDIMEINNFLDFHLKETFENNLIELESFILRILIKYKAILEEKHKPLVDLYLKKSFLKIETDMKNKEILVNDKIEENESNKTMEEQTKAKSEFTIARQVLAIKYLLNVANSKINECDNTEIARFIQFLTGRELDNKVIKNTNIYKKVNINLQRPNKNTVKDLQFIRTFLKN